MSAKEAELSGSTSIERVHNNKAIWRAEREGFKNSLAEERAAILRADPEAVKEAMEEGIFMTRDQFTVLDIFAMTYEAVE